jgi:hypothetical protein
MAASAWLEFLTEVIPEDQQSDRRFIEGIHQFISGMMSISISS